MKLPNRNDYETRSVSDFRAEGDGPEIGGYAAHWLSVDSHHSAFTRSSFRKTIRERGDKIKVLFNHNPEKLIGRVTELRSDSTGLKFRASIVEGTTEGANVMALVRAGVLDGMSFGFRSIKERSGTREDGLLNLPSGIKPEEIRVIEEVALKEISPVPFPSNPNPRIDSFRSEDAEEVIGEILDSLRNMDLTSEHIERLTEEIRSLADTLEEPEPPSGTQDIERRHQMDIDIDLFLLEVE